MPVFGEEVVELSIFNGVSPSLYNRKPALCSSLINLVKTGPKELTVREDFVLIQQDPVAIVAIDLDGIALEELMSLAMFKNVFTVIGSSTVDSPTLVVCGVDRNVTWLNCNSDTPESFTQVMPVNRYIKAFCQFRDRYYGSNGVDQIFKVSNFSTVAATALVSTDLAPVGVDLLITFKNRIFGIKKSRIYFTDLPAIGLYPETWTTAFNFIDIPAVDFDVTIHNAKVFKDKIYLFTNRGIFYLMANGDPINWSVQLVSSSFPIYNRDSVCINRNIVYFTDQNSVFSFDGSKFIKISENIQEIFYNSVARASVFKVYPYEEGVILHRGDYSGTITYWISLTQDNIYYFNGEIWTIINIPGGAQQAGIIKAGNNLLPYRGKTPSSYIYFIDKAINKISCLFLDSGFWKGDCYSTDHVNGTRVDKKVELIGPYPFINSRNFKKIKYFVMYALLNDSDPIFLSAGAITDVVNSAHLFDSADMSNFNSIYKIAVSTGDNLKFVPHYTGFAFQGTIGADRTSVNKNTPSLIITKLEAVINSDNRAVSELKT